MAIKNADGGQMGEVQHDFPRTSQPALRALLAAGYTRLDQLTTVTEADLRKLHGMGPKALGILREALAARGQSFANSGTEDGGRRTEDGGRKTEDGSQQSTAES
jgi:hypothetical protein